MGWKTITTLLLLTGPSLLFIAAFTYESRQIYRTIIVERRKEDRR